MADKFIAKSYRLADDRSGEVFLLKVGRDMNLLVFDKTKGYNRAIRHCPNEKSIFVDEQSDHALVDTIIFEKGYLDVESNQQVTQKFLDTHPSNIANGGNIFEEVDEEKDAMSYVDEEDLKHSIRSVVIEKANEANGIYALEMVASVLTGSLDETRKMTTGEMKRIIYQEIDDNPSYFLSETGEVNIFDDDQMQRKYLTLRALKDGILKKSQNGRAMYWVKGDKKIVTAPVGIELVEFFTDFLSSDDGILVAEEIAKRS